MPIVIRISRTCHIPARSTHRSSAWLVRGGLYDPKKWVRPRVRRDPEVDAERGAAGSIPALPGGRDAGDDDIISDDEPPGIRHPFCRKWGREAGRLEPRGEIAIEGVAGSALTRGRTFRSNTFICSASPENIRTKTKYNDPFS